MAVRDLEAFLRQAAANFDPNLDSTTGSPFDNKVIQPLVRRLGTDPFTTDLSTFLYERLRQAYPKLATDEGDNLTDLLIKPITLLWDPVVRETTRVKRGLSFADPSTLTLEEADSLGGNFFIPRRRGRFARGVARILFSKAQDASINQNNFVRSRGGLVYFPTALQSIRANEMLLNVTADNLFFFDVNVIAENPGTGYNIDTNELTSIANLNAAVRVTNLRRFRQGEDEEDAVSYVGRLEQSLGEKSMVTLRGIAAKLLEAFPEVNRLNVVGFNDPEMQRDVITGGGLGPVLASGVLGSVLDDAEGAGLSRRFGTSEADFDLLIGASPGGFCLTLIGGTASTDPAQDFDVRRVVDSTSIDLEQQELIIGTTGLSWMLRKKELTLSNIPGGILFPNTPNGELKVDSGSIHVGGAFDVHTRTSDFDEATLGISSVFDDVPVLDGQLAVESGTGFLLQDYPDPADEDVISTLLQAELEGWSIQVQDGPNAGTYRILSQSISAGFRYVETSPPPPNVDPEQRRWRIFDVINVDLVEPKETRVSGEDLITVQGSDTVTTGGGLNFDVFGVAEGDTLRLLTGPSAGDYTVIEDPLVPGFSELRVDRPMPFSAANVDYTVFRGEESGLQLPLIRIKSIELLDSSSQPQGSFIPYANPVDVQTRSFQNPARGVKHDFRNTSLGLVSAGADDATKTFTITGGSDTLTVYYPSLVTQSHTIVIPAGSYTVDALVAQINTLLEASTGLPELVVKVNEFHFGFRPVGNGYVAVIGGTARLTLFGDTALHTTADILPEPAPNWLLLDPPVDYTSGLDTAQVVDGRNVGFYGGPFTYKAVQSGQGSLALWVGQSQASTFGGLGTYFSPDVGRRVILGSRSLGSVRVFFLEPTSFQVDGGTIFELDQGDEGVLRFIPDPTLSHQLMPALPDGAVAMDGESVSSTNVFTSASNDFQLSGVKEDDELVIRNHPLKGTIVLGTEVVGLAGTTFVYSIDGGPTRTVVFVRDDPSLNPNDFVVTAEGAIEQINASAGANIAALDGGSVKFATDLQLVIHATGTSLDILLGDIANYTPVRKFSDEDTSNASPHAGTYSIASVAGDTLSLTGAVSAVPEWSSPITEQTFHVLRQGMQRISTTQMAQQQAEAGLYYFDVELISQGAGDAWNIDAGLQLAVSGYKSDGYYLTTDDENLTFSPVERPRLVISRTILEDGVDDDPQNATQVTGQNIQITYDRSPTVLNVQDFALSEIERVVCASPLSRHLIPHFVRFDFEYFGGSDESVVVPDMEKYIREIFPVDSLDSSDLQKTATDRGATKVTNPLTLIAVVHRTDRTVWIQRSQNSLSTGRLSAFIPDGLNVVRNVTGGAVS